MIFSVIWPDEVELKGMGLFGFDAEQPEKNFVPAGQFWFQNKTCR